MRCLRTTGSGQWSGVVTGVVTVGAMTVLNGDRAQRILGVRVVLRRADEGSPVMAEQSGSGPASGTAADPWVLKTAPLTSAYTMYRDDTSEPPLLVCQVGTTKLTYLGRAIEDLHAELVRRGDWVTLGATDEGKEPAADTVEAWGRSRDNPVGGWYGQRKGYRGRFGMYLPPLLETLGLVELEHNARNNRVRALAKGVASTE